MVIINGHSEKLDGFTFVATETDDLDKAVELLLISANKRPQRRGDTYKLATNDKGEQYLLVSWFEGDVNDFQYGMPHRDGWLLCCVRVDAGDVAWRCGF